MSKKKDERTIKNNLKEFTNEKWLNNDLTTIKDVLGKQLIKTIKEKHSQLTKDIENNLPKNNTVYAGISGFSLLQLRLNSLFDSECSLVHISMSRESLYRPLHSLNRSKPSFLNGDCGPLAIGAVVMARLGNSQRSSDFIDRIFTRQPASCNVPKMRVAKAEGENNELTSTSNPTPTPLSETIRLDTHIPPTPTPMAGTVDRIARTVVPLSSSTRNSVTLACAPSLSRAPSTVFKPSSNADFPPTTISIETPAETPSIINAPSIFIIPTDETTPTTSFSTPVTRAPYTTPPVHLGPTKLIVPIKSLVPPVGQAAKSHQSRKRNMKRQRSVRTSRTKSPDDNGQPSVPPSVAEEPVESTTANQPSKVHRIREPGSKPHIYSMGTCDEVMNGRSGYLYTLLYLQKYLGHSTVPENIITKTFYSIINSGRNLSLSLSHSSPLIFHWHKKMYYGAAHGMAGILYLLLKVDIPLVKKIQNEFVIPSAMWIMNQQFKYDPPPAPRLNSTKALKSSFKPESIEEAEARKKKKGNFPSRLGRPDDLLVQWCHGSPGIIYMLLQAHKLSGMPNFLSSARTACDGIWHHGLLKKGHGLCHGTSGNAYAFLAMYNYTGEPVYLHRAVKFAEFIISDQTKYPKADRPSSLYEGLAGEIYFLADMLDPLNAAFPGFEI